MRKTAVHCILDRCALGLATADGAATGEETKPKRFMTRVWLGLIIAAIVLVVPPIAQAENVVPNPGFEVGACASDWARGTIVCDWDPVSGLIWQSRKPHSGAASLGLFCEDGQSGCSATTEHGRCAAIGPGTHPASFWFRVERPWTGTEFVGMVAWFFEKPNCSGSSTGRQFSATGNFGGLWSQATGDLVAPPGTKSAHFWVGAASDCTACDLEAYFDDLYLDSGTRPTPRSTSVRVAEAST